MPYCVVCSRYIEEGIIGPSCRKRTPGPNPRKQKLTEVSFLKLKRTLNKLGVHVNYDFKEHYFSATPLFSNEANKQEQERLIAKAKVLMYHHQYYGLSSQEQMEFIKSVDDVKVPTLTIPILTSDPSTNSQKK